MDKNVNLVFCGQDSLKNQLYVGDLCRIVQPIDLRGNIVIIMKKRQDKPNVICEVFHKNSIEIVYAKTLILLVHGFYTNGI